LRATDDRRQVLVKLTHDGEEFLKSLSLHHLQELQTAGPKLLQALQSVIENSKTHSALETDTENLKSTISTKIRKDTNHG
jgi:DNA-binding MarR family transcriptional regulator